MAPPGVAAARGWFVKRNAMLRDPGIPNRFTEHIDCDTHIKCHAARRISVPCHAKGPLAPGKTPESDRQGTSYIQDNK